RHPRGNHDPVHVRNFQVVHGKQVAEDHSVLVDGAGQVRTDPPVRHQSLVTCRLRSHVLARTMRYRRKNAQHRIRVSDIDNQKHKIHVGTAALGCPAARRAAGSANAVELCSTGQPRGGVPTRIFTVPLSAVLNPSAVLTRKNPRSSNPSVTPARPPFSSIVTFLPRTDEELSSNRRRIPARAPASATRPRY